MKYKKEYIDSLTSSTTYSFVCGQCKSLFDRKAKDVKRRFKKRNVCSVYCSRKCHIQSATIEYSCKECEIKILQKKSKNKQFCSQSCAASYSNKLRAATPRQYLKCLYCKAPSYKNNKYCSKDCQRQKQNETSINLFKEGKLVHRKTLRKILGFLNGNKCSICNLYFWLDKPILLIVDHINGYSDNNLPENLRLVCSNCDATLPTYKAKNKGRGRKNRRMKQ